MVAVLLYSAFLITGFKGNLVTAQKRLITDLKPWLHASRWLSLVLPFGSLVLLLLLVLVVMFSLNNRASQDAFERQTEVEVLEVAGLLADQLDQDLLALQGLGKLLASQAERTFTQPPVEDDSFLDEMEKSSQGVLYSTDQQSAAIFFSALQERSLNKDREQLLRLHSLAPLLKDIQASHELIVQAYITTPTSEILVYPWLDASEQFADQLDVRDFSFHYLADPLHNPRQEPVWVGTYYDPAGQGWVLSLSLPVLVEGELVAVVGLDLTLDRLVNRMVELSPPWKSYTLLMAANGHLLAFPPEGEAHWGIDLRSPRSSSSEQNLNLLLRADLRSQLEPLRQDASGLIPLNLASDELFLSWSTLQANDWKLLLVTPKEAVFSARQQLLKDYQLMAWLGIACLVFSASCFVLFSNRRDERLLSYLQQQPDEEALQSEPKPSPEPAKENPLQLIPGPLLIAQFDAEERLVFCNQAFEAFAKQSGPQLRGQLLAPFLNMKKLPDGQWTDELEIQADRQKNKSWWLSVARQGDQSGYICLLDLSPYRMTQQQLESERERAHQAAKMKAEFSQVVMREANELLAALQEATRQVPSPEKAQACREKITAVQHLLDDLRDMSDEAELLDEQAAEQQLIDLQAWVNEGRAPIDAELKQQQRQLSLKMADNLPIEVLGDRRRMTRLLRHLLRQTLMLAPQGDLVLQLSWLPETRCLLVVLQDQGGGLPVEERIQRFQASTPLGSNYEPASGALGMGPLLTRQLVQELKGSLDVQPTSLGGLEVRLEFPVTPITEEQPQIRILVVDDGPVNSMLASSVLEKSGYQVDIANSGRRALELGRQQEYALVLMDIFMPDMDGLETTRHWRKLPGINARIPLIALTANALESDRNYFIAQGMDDYLAKPYRPKELRTLVEFWLSKREVEE